MLESIPNVSEGRRPEVIDRLARAVNRPGVWLLDRTSDPDHHRSVFTLAGEPEPLIDALFALYERALQEVDLRRPRGVHPRLGAVDVVPFVPLASRPMADAVAAAEVLGRRVAERFGLPVLLYEQAARRPERQRLPKVRRGGFERLAERLAVPGGEPDFGPRRPHPSAGATVIGARDFLIAFNFVLSREDLALARGIAAEIREAAGGLAGVRALGLALESRRRAQVSVNLVDTRATTLRELFDAVQSRARKAGAEVDESELIGLLPAHAVEGDLADLARDLRLPRLERHQVVEWALEDAGA
ncbi:MAG: glutamate formimidoyltransferase [Acidobacteriota bacterium]